MCVVEQKTYPYTDGSHRIVETIRYCRNSKGSSKLCKRVERKTVQQARFVERRPATADKPADDGYFVTESSTGRTRTYRDISNRSSNSSFARRSAALSDPSPPISIPSSASSPPVPVDTMPTAPSPPSPSSHFPQERRRAPYPPPSEPSKIVTGDGTAIYDRPPSLDMPRAVENERPSSSRPRRLSNTSTTAEVDDSEPLPSRPRRRPTVRIDTTEQGSFSTRSVESPGLSHLPNIRRSGREDAEGQAVRDDSFPSVKRPTIDAHIRRGEEEARHAWLENERIAESERRQGAREHFARANSSARHRRQAAAALGGNAPQPPLAGVDPIEAQVQAEYAQMARERAAAAARRDSLDQAAQLYAAGRLQRDAEARARFYSTRQSPTSVRPPSRHGPGGQSIFTYDTSTSPGIRMSPVSPRASLARPPVVHQYQYPSPRRRESVSMRERGEEVIAREQARAATDRLSEAMGRMDMADGGRNLEWAEERERNYFYDEDQHAYVPADRGYDVREETGGNGRRRRARDRYA